MNGLSYQVLHTKKLPSEGKNFKPIFGVEAYFIPSISEWKDAYDKYKEEKKSKKADEDEESGIVVEDEEESKPVKEAIDLYSWIMESDEDDEYSSNRPSGDETMDIEFDVSLDGEDQDEEDEETNESEEVEEDTDNEDEDDLSGSSGGAIEE